MTRKKVKLTYITNDAARKATFKKRKRGLLKKVSELTTLCGIQACAIIYSPYEAQPEAWPSVVGVNRVISQFRNMPEMEQSKKMVNQETFLRQRVLKASEQLKRQSKDNREKEMSQIMFHALAGINVQNMSIMDLNDLNWLIDHNLKDINKRIDTLKKDAPAAPPPTASKVETVEETVPAEGENVQRQPWYVEMMNPQENMGLGFGGDDMINNNGGGWSGGFLP